MWISGYQSVFKRTIMLETSILYFWYLISCLYLALLLTLAES